MKYIMTGRNVEVTQAMREYAEKKLSRIEKFFNEDTEANVTFSVEKKRHILGVTIYFEGNTYRAEATNDDLYVSIDKGIDLLEGQIRKVKTKRERLLKDDVLIYDIVYNIICIINFTSRSRTRNNVIINITSSNNKWKCNIINDSTIWQ